jgi:methyl-accepting chemotaxis protein
MSPRKIVLPICARVALAFSALLLLMFGMAVVTSVSMTQLIDAAEDLQALHLHLRQQRAQLAAMAASAMLIGALVAWRCTRSLSHPIRAVVDQAWRLAGGDLAMCVVRNRRDELGELQQALACLQEQLRHIEQLRRLMLQVRDGCELLSSGPGLFDAANAEQLAPTHQRPALARSRSEFQQPSGSTSIHWRQPS